ncbi:hypothetical protein BD410DRAFT_750406 [Rickenella mellea]|uniref:CNH domain-containing protein n=1 Tax=Rickenella mellea TaxID=50990 RepID=A0A4Y7PZH0_9AGAM|nr:hypothetical protein BD410DRAFT_750406 [Rickenella mellea]
MAPFHPPVAVINGFKDKIESNTVQGDRVFIGTSLGSLHIFNIDTAEDGTERATPVSNKNISRKPIDQLGYIKDINSVVALSDSSVTLYPLPDLIPPTPLPQTRNTFSFAINSTVQGVLPNGKTQAFEDGGASQAAGIPAMVTNLVVGCRKKLVIYTWRDGEAQGVKEAVLPHSARAIAFITPQILCLAYTATDHVLFFLETMSASELTLPPANVAAAASAAIGNMGMGMGALSGLGGYMTLGLGAKAKPMLAKVGEGEILVPKDNSGIFIGPDGKPTRTSSIDWPAPPEDLAFVRPYVFAVMPPGSVTSPSTTTTTTTPQPPSPILQIRSSLSLSLSQSIHFPFPPPKPHPAPSVNYTLRLLTPSPAAKSPLFAVSSPIERNAFASEGSTVWLVKMRTWSEQVDELVEAEKYEDALSLLDIIDQATLSDKAERQEKVRALHAVSQFKQGDYDSAINTFLALDINPAKVVALFPETVSGRLYIPRDRWISLYGGPDPPSPQPPTSSATATADAPPPAGESGEVQPGGSEPASHVQERLVSPVGSMRGRLMNTIDAIMPLGGKEKEDDTKSISDKHKERPAVDELKRSVEVLLRYLTDRRPKVKGALELVHITPAQSHQFPFLSSTSVDDLMALPNKPFSALTPEQLTRFAQIIDTALFKAYLLTHPGLLGPLCRIDNWCEVSEVEEVLQVREKFAELIFLYNGKKMHGKALALLKRLSEKESDKEDRLRPTVTYLQKLGPEYLDQIFESSRWVFEQDPDLGFEIFTSEQVELPRSAVTDFLEEINPRICARYLEFLIAEREENSTLFHDRLAELYLELVVLAKKANDEEERKKSYAKLLEFIETSQMYRTDRLFGLLPSDDMFEARAILLGKLGKHQGALEIYVYRLNDYLKAEEYCKSIYMPNSPTQDIFLTLLRIYLQPTQSQSANLLRPALDLISRQSPRLDTMQTLQLLPPLVTAQDVKPFLIDALRVPVFDTHVVRDINKARSEQVAMKLMVLQNKRVVVTDSRICPQCHKRIGGSVIAVHTPRGEVTHYQCREAFARRIGHVH